MSSHRTGRQLNIMRIVPLSRVYKHAFCEHYEDAYATAFNHQSWNGEVGFHVDVRMI